ncbi:Transient receptor putative cation channel subfamily M member 2 [Cichlidogyrus casuarinus]|uniref:Transient receptor putative cation channel subfamily M member 2 n=1 Tax=Cichlidogyrus casuarinus TaxID=1844966 RepID=A0ABD2QKB7_9PLAT
MTEPPSRRNSSRKGSVYSQNAIQHSQSGAAPLQTPGALLGATQSGLLGTATPGMATRRLSQLQTKYFAEIEFTGLNQTAKFAKFAENTPDCTIRDLLKRKWSLKPPTLIITVFGTDFEKKRKLKMIFKKGLWKAAESGCWIVTGGFNLGIMKLAGEAVRDYTDAYGGNRMMAFGVASWGCITKNDMLDQALIEGTGIYQVEEDDEDENIESEGNAAGQDGQNAQKIVKTDVEERALDPNHNYFVLVDTGTDQTKGNDAETRARFERCISQWGSMSPDVNLLDTSQNQGRPGPTSSAAALQSTGNLLTSSGTLGPAAKKLDNSIITEQSSGPVAPTRVDSIKEPQKSTAKKDKAADDEEIRVPMCGLVIGGDRFTLRQVYCSVIQNRCPMVIAKGTSGAADAIAFGLDTANKAAAEEAVEDKEPIPLETRWVIFLKFLISPLIRLISVLEEFLGEMHSDYRDWTEESQMLADLIINYASLVSVFDMEEDSDLDGYMISALLASG